MDVPVATGYDPLLDNEPELARTMAASVKQRSASPLGNVPERRYDGLAQVLAMQVNDLNSRDRAVALSD